MKKHSLRAIIFLFAFLTIGSVAPQAKAQILYHANGGAYWSQNGGGWNTINNDGYCVNGRGPCGANLRYMQWNGSKSGCGSDALGRWNMSSVVGYLGDVYAWIDSTAGNMYGADYTVSYNYGSSYNPTVDQSPYYEQWATVALDKFRVSNVQLSDGWGNPYICNAVSGLRVEFDEIKLQI